MSIKYPHNLFASVHSDVQIEAARDALPNSAYNPASNELGALAVGQLFDTDDVNWHQHDGPCAAEDAVSYQADVGPQDTSEQGVRIGIFRKTGCITISKEVQGERIMWILENVQDIVRTEHTVRIRGWRKDRFHTGLVTATVNVHTGNRYLRALKDQ